MAGPYKIHMPRPCLQHGRSRIPLLTASGAVEHRVAHQGVSRSLETDHPTAGSRNGHAGRHGYQRQRRLVLGDPWSISTCRRDEVLAELAALVGYHDDPSTARLGVARRPGVRQARLIAIDCQLVGNRSWTSWRTRRKVTGQGNDAPPQRGSRP